MPPKKAKRAADADAGQPAKATRAEGTPAAAGGGVLARVAVDNYVPGGAAGAQVYQDAGVNWGVMLNQTDVKNNNNKFYIIQIVERNGTYTTFTRWGRVGEPGQNAPFVCHGNLEQAKKTFCDKFKDKTKNKWDDVKTDPSKFNRVAGKYHLVDVALEEDGADGAVVKDTAGAAKKTSPSKLKSQLQAMLKVIFDKDMFKSQMAEHKLDANKMPLGKLSKTQLDKGYDALKKIEQAVNDGKSKSVLADLSSEFYSTIPHNFGRMVPPAIDTAEAVTKKFELLNLLTDIQVAVAVDAAAEGGDADLHPLDKQFAELDCGLEYVDPKSDEFKLINTYTEETQGYRKCRIEHAFRVDRPQDKKRMQAHASEGNRRLLWHGTNIAVVAAILKTGLRLMPHAGGRVGRGLYFASENGKSAGYVRIDHTSKIGYMFLCEIVMGEAKEINQDDSRLCKEKIDQLGVNSIIARGRQEPDPSKDKTLQGEWGPMTVPQGKPQPRTEPQWQKSTFHQSEYLVYEESRVRVKYVLQMRFS